MVGLICFQNRDCSEVPLSGGSRFESRVGSLSHHHDERFGRVQAVSPLVGIGVYYVKHGLKLLWAEAALGSLRQVQCHRRTQGPHRRHR